MRPISPYLSIYKPQLGSIFSIFGRITGGVLFLTFLFYFLLIFLYPFFASTYTFYLIYFFFFKGSTFLSLGIAFFVLVNFVYHLLFSIRYLYWSYTGGIGNLLYMTLENIYKLAYYIIFGVIVFSVFIWFIL